MDIKSIVARSVGISGHRKRRSVFILERRAILPVLFAARQLSFTMIWSTTATTAAVTRSATTPCCTEAYRYLCSVHVPTLWKDRFQADALPCSCDSNGLEHVLPGQELVPQYRIDSAYRDECPGVPHDHQ